MVVLSRTDSEIEFGRTTEITYDYPIIPYFLTTPDEPPRSIVHEFNVGVRGIEIEDEK